MGKILENDITLEKCVECGKVHDPWLDMWLPSDSFDKDIYYVDSYCKKHDPEYKQPDRKLNKGLSYTERL